MFYFYSYLFKFEVGPLRDGIYNLPPKFYKSFLNAIGILEKLSKYERKNFIRVFFLSCILCVISQHTHAPCIFFISTDLKRLVLILIGTGSIPLRYTHTNLPCSYLIIANLFFYLSICDHFIRPRELLTTDYCAKYMSSCTNIHIDHNIHIYHNIYIDHNTTRISVLCTSYCAVFTLHLIRFNVLMLVLVFWPVFVFKSFLIT